MRVGVNIFGNTAWICDKCGSQQYERSRDQGPPGEKAAHYSALQESER